MIRYWKPALAAEALRGSVAALVLLLSMSPMAASAATFSVVNDFGSSNFAYGGGVGGSNAFTALSNNSVCGFGLDCYRGSGFLPQVLKNTLGTDFFDGGTVVVPGGAVHFHPGFASTGEDAIIRFIAPIAGLYTIGGSFARQDITANGNGTRVSIFSNVGGTYSSLFTNTIAANSYGNSTPFSGLTANLGVGDTIDFALNNLGDYAYDSTGITANLSVASVPEPATWAMMIIGFGAVGSAMRSRRRAPLAA